ncbi:MAG TPA: Gfo/Idh/MocA family oxidoreductase [Planctomycetota bacterium]|nr:Gfo/Idh/MocA family oxidoreductase [Planctomycetota bacterium]
MAKRVRIGVVGAGFAAHFHLASYEKVYGEDFEILGIYGRTKDKAVHLAKDFEIPKVYDSYEQMLADKDIDVVDLVVANFLHIPMAIQAANAGKHVFCEKPLTGFFGPADAKGQKWTAKGYSRESMFQSIVEDANKAWDAIKKAGVTLCYGENWVYAPPIVKVNRLLAASGSTIMRIIGEESHSGSHAQYAKRWQTAGGGSLIRLSVHPVGAACYLKYEEGRRRNGKPIRPVAVTAEVANLTWMKSFQDEPKKHMKSDWDDVEDYGTIHLTFDDGSVACLTSSDIVMGGIYNYLQVFGSRAVLKANINPNTACLAYTPSGEYFKDEYLVEKTESKEGWSFPSPDEDMVTGYPDELRDFVGAISHGRPPKSDLMLAHDVLMITYAAYLSSEKGARIDLRPYLRS